MTSSVKTTSEPRKRSYAGRLFWSLYAISALLLLMLGTWQVLRHVEKNKASNIVARQTTLPSESLDHLLSLKEDGFYRKTSFQGVMLHEHTIYLYTGPMTVNGSPGYDVITPVRLVDSNVTIAVNRGWIPQSQYKSGGVITPKEYAGIVLTLDAVLVPAESPGTFTPDNDDKNNIWFWIDTDAIAARSGASALPVYAVLEKNPDELVIESAPIPREIRTRKYLPHASYAVTWYSLFLILTFIVFRLHRDYKKRHSETSQENLA